MIVRVYKDGTLDLRQIFTKKDVQKIVYYKITNLEDWSAVRLQLFDKDKKELGLKLRKRGQAKKA